MIYADIKDSPAYRNEEYLAVSGEWDYLKDMFKGISRWSTLKDGLLSPTSKAQSYLPKHPEEDSTEYLHRFRMTEFDDAFARSIKEYCDLMFANGIDLKAPDSFMQQWRSLSDTGDSGNVLLPQVAMKAMIYGVSHIFIDYSGDRPRWIPIEPISIPNWSVMMVDGLQVLQHVSIFSRSNGRNYLTKYERGGGWVRYAYIKLDNGSYEFSTVDTGTLKAKSVPLKEIPLVSFHVSYSRDSLIVGDRLFRSLADKNKTLYQVTADYRRKMQLCSTPQPVQYDPMGDDDDVILSPNRILKMRSPDAYFRWVEASTGSLSASRREMMDITQTIQADSTRFLQNPTARVSAGASEMSVAPLQATLLGFSNSFTQGVKQAIAFHQNYMGDTFPIEIEIMPSLVKQQPKDSQAALSASNLYTSHVLTRRSAVMMLNEAHIISDEIASEELKLPEDLPTNE
jgi:hypothetical protein